jgi:hypothetical protein
MKAFEGFPKGLPKVFAATVAIYLVAFYGIEHMRSRKGPWTVGYETDANGRPTLVVNQPGLGISDVRIVFAEEAAPTNFQPATVTFEAPQHVPFELPFGECFFQDLTFLPGTVTLRPFPGHEVELLPRALYVNRREEAWVPGTTFEEFQTNRVPHLVEEMAPEADLRPPPQY